jgi:ribosome-associated protein
MAVDDLEIGGGIVIPANELRESASRSSGPGGQHVNKTSTRVSLRWSVSGSEALGPAQRARLIDRLGARLTRAGDLVVHAEGSRSRTRNREAARERLAELVADLLRVPRVRRPSRPSRGAREDRMRSKKRRADVKRGRGQLPDDSG